MFSRALLAAVLLVFLLPSCASTRGGPASPPGPVTVVEVQNRNWADITIYVIRSGMRQRLGSVVSMTTERLKVPAGVLSGSEGIRLHVEVLGSRDAFTTEAIQVQPGDRVQFDVENHLAISSYSVWRQEEAERFAGRDTLPSGWMAVKVHEDWDAWTVCATRPKSWMGHEIDPAKWDMVWAHEAEHRAHMAEFPSCKAWYAWKKSDPMNQVRIESRAFCVGARVDHRAGRYPTFESAVWGHAGYMMWYFSVSQEQAAAWILAHCP